MRITSCIRFLFTSSVAHPDWCLLIIICPYMDTLQTYSLLCVISQYQEFKAGRGSGQTTLFGVSYFRIVILVLGWRRLRIIWGRKSRMYVIDFCLLKDSLMSIRVRHLGHNFSGIINVALKMILIKS